MTPIKVPRLTLVKAFSIDGLGLHSGVPVSVTVHPGEEGIWLRNQSERLEAIPENVTDTSRSTTLGSIRTIEHLMSALAGAGITEAEVEVTGGELPGADGSSLPFLQAIKESGTTQIGEQEVLPLFARIFHQSDQASIGIATGDGHWRFDYESGPNWPRKQSYEVDCLLRDYGSQIAPARTFAMEEEVPFLKQLQLGQGLDASSAVVVGQIEYVNDVRFGDELARHKLLDLVGDLALSGYPLDALNIVAIKSGHATNVAAAKKLRDAFINSAG